MKDITESTSIQKEQFQMLKKMMAKGGSRKDLNGVIRSWNKDDSSNSKENPIDISITSSYDTRGARGYFSNALAHATPFSSIDQLKFKKQANQDDSEDQSERLQASSGIQESTPPLKMKTIKAGMIRHNSSKTRIQTSKSIHNMKPPSSNSGLQLKKS